MAIFNYFLFVKLHAACYLMVCIILSLLFVVKNKLLVFVLFIIPRSVSWLVLTPVGRGTGCGVG